jgi:DNA-binding NtrC family response regulator
MAAILIVDDDAAVRDVLYDLLSDEHLCHSASTAEQALAFIREQPYDVVLTDISMPGLSGVELLGHLRQSQPDTPVIIISGIGDRAHAEGLRRLGAFDFIYKPFQLRTVEESVARALEHNRTLKARRASGEG